MAGFALHAEQLMQLEDRLAQFHGVAQESREVFRHSLRSNVARIAERSPRWIGLVDHIDTWDENDRMWVGLRGQDVVSEAFNAEYGSEQYPPAPLLRMLDAPMNGARMQADLFMKARLA